MEHELARVDKSKNRVYLYFEGEKNIEDAQKLFTAYKDAIDACQPGFTVMTYATDFIPGTPAVQEIVQEMTQYADQAGVSKIARIVGKTPLGGMQINRLAREHTKFESRHFQTKHEAEAYLDE